MDSKLPVMWTSNAKAWVTQQFFTEWMHEVFCTMCEKISSGKRIAIEMPPVA